MSERIYVIGHKNPDTDSICSAIAFAQLKERLGYNGVIACRAGKLNKESEFVLNYFEVPVPEFVPDLSLRVRDLINGHKAPIVRAGTSLYEASLLMKRSEQKTLPVIDSSGRMQGIITIGDLSQTYLEHMGDLDFTSLHVPIKNVVATLKGELLAGDENSELRGQVFVGAMHYATLEQVVKPGDILLLGNRSLAQESALRLGVSALILTGGATLSEELLEVANEGKVAVITVEHDTFTAARLLPMSAPVESIMKTEQIESFQEDDLISEVRKKMLQTRFRNYPVLDEQERVVGLIGRYQLLSMTRKKVILVDHNEWGQAVDGAEQAQVLEIIDHHRVGGIQTGEPILFRNEPVGSTCTLVAQCYRENGITPEPEIAGLMLAGIISDTVMFKSPTATEKDREMAQYLEALSGVKVQTFGVQMFKESSNIAEKPVTELIQEDLKEFAIGDFSMAIGQTNIMGLEGLERIRAEVKREMDDLRERKGLSYLLLMVTDLLEDSTELLISGNDPEEVAKAFEKPLKGYSVYLPGVLSRKKQVVPPLSRHFLG